MTEARWKTPLIALRRLTPGQTLAAAALLWLLALLVSIRYAATAWKLRAPWTAHVPYGWDLGLTDFRDTAMLPNIAMRQGLNPYDVPAYLAKFPQAQEFDAYAPWWLTATSGLSRLQWPTATLIYVVALVTLAVVAAVLAARELRPDLRQPAVRWCVAAVCVIAVWAWRPHVLALGLGNISALIGLAAGLVLISRSEVAGSVALAVCWIKPQFGVPLCLLLLCRGQWRRVVFGTALATVASIPAVVTLSRLAGGFGPLASSVIDGARYTDAQGGSGALAGRMDLGGLAAVLHWYPGAAVTSGIGLVLLAAAGMASRRLKNDGRTPESAWVAALAILLSFPHFHYDLTALLFPALACFASWSRTPPRTRWWVVSLLIATVACLIPGALLGHNLPQNEILLVGLWGGATAAVVALAAGRVTHRPQRQVTPAA